MMDNLFVFLHFHAECVLMHGDEETMSDETIWEKLHVSWFFTI